VQGRLSLEMLGGQGRSETATSMVRLRAVAIRMADNPIEVVLFMLFGRYLPGKPMQV
jgi:hypothetical protein